MSGVGYWYWNYADEVKNLHHRWPLNTKYVTSGLKFCLTPWPNAREGEGGGAAKETVGVAGMV